MEVWWELRYEKWGGCATEGPLVVGGCFRAVRDACKVEECILLEVGESALEM